MATEIGHAALGIIPSFDGFQSKLESGTSRGMSSAGTKGGLIFGDAAGKSAGSRFGSLFKSAAKASLIGVAGLAAVAFKVGKDSIESASTLNESLNAVNVTYGEQAKAVKKLGRQAATSLGLSNTEFNSLSVRFSAFAKTVGGGGEDTVAILDDLTTRAADFASVMNLEVNEAAELFQSGLAGETEPLRKYGLDLSAAAVEAKGLALGMSIASEGMTETQKVQARYALLMQKTSKAQGDFANTSDSLANRQRILSARWEDAKAALGKGLLPIVEDFAGFLLDEGIPAVERFAEWFSEDGVDGLKRFGKFTKDEILPVLKDVADFAGDAAGFVGDLVGAFNDLPKGAKLGILAGAIGAVGATKLRGGSGITGGIGSAIGLAKPVPVFVTNPGFGGVGGKPGAPIVTGAASKVSKLARFGTLSVAAGTIVFGPEIAKSWKESFDEALAGDGFMPSLDGLNLPKPPRIPNSPIGLGWSPFGGPDENNPGENRSLIEQSISGFDTSGIGRNFQGIPIMAEQALEDTAQAFRDANIPTQLKTEIAMNGVPESMRQAKSLVAQYDLTPEEKRTLFELLGYEKTRGQIQSHIQALSGIPKQVQTDINVNIGGALAQIGTVTGALHGLSALGASVGDQIRANAAAADRNFERAANRMGV